MGLKYGVAVPRRIAACHGQVGLGHPNNSLKNGVNETRTDNCEGLSHGRCPVGKHRGLGRRRNTARKTWTKRKLR